jgi:PKD repeat protein
VWSDGNIGATNTVSPSTTTTYYVTGTNTAGCTDADVVTVNVNPSATAGFTASVVGSSAVTNNTSTGAASYQWNFGDNTPSDNSANPVHTYTANGTYTITLIVTGICGSDTMTQVVTITQVGLQDIDLSNTLEVYPNPNDGVFTIAFELSSAKTVQIEVLDVQGRKVVEQRLESVLVHREQLDLSGSESGIYVLRIITTDGVATQKIVVKH